MSNYESIIDKYSPKVDCLNQLSDKIRAKLHAEFRLKGTQPPSPDIANDDFTTSLRGDYVGPFQFYGFGISAYFKLMSRLGNLFCILSVFALTSCAIYIMSAGHPPRTAELAFPFGYASLVSLGNLAHSKAVCLQHPIDFISRPIELSCDHGLLSDVLQVGIVGDGENLTLEKEVIGLDYCGNSDNLA